MRHYVLIVYRSGMTEPDLREFDNAEEYRETRKTLRRIAHRNIRQPGRRVYGEPLAVKEA